MLNRTTRIGTLLLALLALAAPAALAQVPQTIVIDGINDFDPANLLDADGSDTEHPTLDIGDVYVTNDAVNLYVGMVHDQADWTTVQLGVAIDVGTPDGGTTDPWGRQIDWSLMTNKPDFIFYINMDNDWQGGLRWNGVDDWEEIGTAGVDGYGWQDNTGGFKEFSVLLSTLGVSASDPLNFEMWCTQDGVNKGPLDAAASDDSQLSVAGDPGTTIWETTTPIPMTDYLAYTVQSSLDSDPPLVSFARHTVDSQVDVTFNEPVDQATAETPGNYAVTGATVVSATRDAVDLNVVHLGLAADIGPSASLYQVTVTGVKDLALNTIVADGSGNVSCFMIKNVLFRGRMSQYLALSSSPPDGFTVEGGLAPLTWSLCDGMDGVDVGDSVYEVDADFCVVGDCGAGTATAGLEWKWVHNCANYEPLAGNRVHTLDLAEGAYDTLDVWWNDEDPTQFTAHDIDVEFFVDMNVFGYAPGDTVAINGSAAPLTYDVPSVNELVDDGSGNDAVSGDGIFSTVLRFPAGSRKDVAYKFLLNRDYECFGQGDRTVFLNDELFDTVGGALGPLTLPVVHYDRCTTTWRGVEVVFRVDLSNSAWSMAGPGDVVAVNGTPHNSVTPAFSWDVPSLNPLADDGVAPDAAAGDLIYSGAVVFPDSSQIFTEYKYLFNDVYECSDTGNRSFTVDADNFDDAGNPQVLPVDAFQLCGTTDVPGAARARLLLEQNAPNPFNPMTEIRFTVHRAGSGSLRVYNVAGELVRSLKEGAFAAGPHVLNWDGRTAAGDVAPSGVYFYRLEVDGFSDARKMVLLK